LNVVDEFDLDGKTAKCAGTHFRQWVAGMPEKVPSASGT
jgi:hypothetical protein